MFKFIDNIPLAGLVIVAVFLGLAPFTPEPHLVEKTRMLINGNLHKPIDIFDFLMHGTPLVLLVIKLLRLGKAKNE